MSHLAIADSDAGVPVAAAWAGPLLALGNRVAKIAENLSRQLVVVVSVPRRDFAAALLGCGWVIASKAPTLSQPLDVLRSLEPGAFIRVVNDHEVIHGRFNSLNETVYPPRIQFAGSGWRVDLIRAVSRAPERDQATKMARPSVGSVGQFARLDEQWDARLASPAADLAIVGTLSWLQTDFNACIARRFGSDSLSPMRNLLLPNINGAATWFTRVYASAGLAEKLPLPPGVRAVILDGTGASKYLSQIEVPVAICILDRSIADEAAGERLVNLRNTRGEPVSVADEVGWSLPTGVEAMCFTMPL